MGLKRKVVPKRILGLLLVFGAISLTARVFWIDTAHPTPTVVPFCQPTATYQTMEPHLTGTPASAKDTFRSGGLGLTLGEWENKFGKPKHGVYSFRYILDVYGASPYYVMEIVRQIEYGQYTSKHDAICEAHALLPADASLVKQYVVDDTDMGAGYKRSFEIYHSPAGVNRFPTWDPGYGAYDWTLLSPGDLSILYRFDRQGNLYGWQMDAGYAP